MRTTTFTSESSSSLGSQLSNTGEELNIAQLNKEFKNNIKNNDKNNANKVFIKLYNALFDQLVHSIKEEYKIDLPEEPFTNTGIDLTRFNEKTLAIVTLNILRLIKQMEKSAKSTIINATTGIIRYKINPKTSDIAMVNQWHYLGDYLHVSKSSYRDNFLAFLNFLGFASDSYFSYLYDNNTLLKITINASITGVSKIKKLSSDDPSTLLRTSMYNFVDKYYNKLADNTLKQNATPPEAEATNNHAIEASQEIKTEEHTDNEEVFHDIPEADLEYDDLMDVDGSTDEEEKWEDCIEGELEAEETTQQAPATQPVEEAKAITDQPPLIQTPAPAELAHELNTAPESKTTLTEEVPSSSFWQGNGDTILWAIGLVVCLGGVVAAITFALPAVAVVLTIAALCCYAGGILESEKSFPEDAPNQPHFTHAKTQLALGVPSSTKRHSVSIDNTDEVVVIKPAPNHIDAANEPIPSNLSHNKNAEIRATYMNIR